MTNYAAHYRYLVSDKKREEEGEREYGEKGWWLRMYVKSSSTARYDI
jgi:hypothetical protein